MAREKRRTISLNLAALANPKTGTTAKTPKSKGRKGKIPKGFRRSARVARNELPWVDREKNQNPNVVSSIMRRKTMQPPIGL
jgi:hypothetical protein